MVKSPPHNVVQSFKKILDGIKRYLNGALSAFWMTEYYSIDYINLKTKHIGIIERGISIEFKICDFNHYLFMLDRMPNRDIFLLSYMVSMEGIVGCSILEVIDNQCVDSEMVLEGELRSGMFRVFDVIRRELNTLTVLEILENLEMFKRFSKFDIFQIGLLSGKSKSSLSSIQRIYSAKLR